MSKQVPKNDEEIIIKPKPIIFDPKKNNTENEGNNEEKISYDISLDKTIVVLFANDYDPKTTKQFLNIFELGIYNLGIQNVDFKIEFFENDKDLKKIIENNLFPGRIFLGPMQSKYTKNLGNYCDNQVLFFSFSSQSSIAKDCIYLLNFFPKNELTQLLLYLNEDAKVALLYPENEYGYLINSFIDDIIFESRSILVNRSSYKDDLSNARDAIKELGKYELRKYELNRQKKILKTRNDEKSKKRLKKL